MTKISGYLVHDNGTAIGTLPNIFANGALAIGGTPDADVNWIDIPKRDIIEHTLEAAVAAAVAWTQNVVIANNAVAGEKFVISISYPDSRQRRTDRFTYYAAGADTPTVIGDAFRDLINAHEIPVTATGAAGTVTLTADTAGTGINYMVEAGGNSATTTLTPGAVTADVEVTSPAYYAAKYDGVDAADFGDAAAFYDAYVFKYYAQKQTAHGIVMEERYQALFTEAAVVGTTLDDALAGDYNFGVDGLGVDGNLAV